jgi:crotonobetainyl-CoA:carnitine CoA-transferase CaiB-like acyl-CoA transferase
MGSGVPIQFSGRGRAEVGCAAWVGEHNDDVLGGILQLSPTEIADLRKRGVI